MNSDMNVAILKHEFSLVSKTTKKAIATENISDYKTVLPRSINERRNGFTVSLQMLNSDCWVGTLKKDNTCFNVKLNIDNNFLDKTTANFKNSSGNCTKVDSSQCKYMVETDKKMLILSASITDSNGITYRGEVNSRFEAHGSGEESDKEGLWSFKGSYEGGKPTEGELSSKNDKGQMCSVFVKFSSKEKKQTSNYKNKLTSLKYQEGIGTFIFKYLLSMDINTPVTEEDSRFLDVSIFFGNSNVTKCLLDLGAEVDAQNDDDETALMIAARESNLDALQVLIDNGAEIHGVNADGETALMIAAAGGHTDILQALIDNNADINRENADGETALMIAAAGGHTNILQALIDNNADINRKNAKGHTALMIAAAGGHTNILQALIDNNADINRKNAKGHTALMIATGMGFTDISQALIDNNADINIKSAKGNTALMIAAEIGHTDVLQVLIKAGASVNNQDATGETVLMIAADMGHIGASQTLIDCGADIHIKNADGNTALMLAEHQVIEKCLIKNGAHITNLSKHATENPDKIKRLVRLKATIDITKEKERESLRNIQDPQIRQELNEQSVLSQVPRYIRGSSVKRDHTGKTKSVTLLMSEGDTKFRVSLKLPLTEKGMENLAHLQKILTDSISPLHPASKQAIVKQPPEDISIEKFLYNEVPGKLAKYVEISTITKA